MASPLGFFFVKKYLTFDAHVVEPVSIIPVRKSEYGILPT